MFFTLLKTKGLPAVVQWGYRTFRAKGAKAGSAGFTLMEVLVSTSIFVMVALASLSIYAASLKASQKTTVLTRIQQETQLIMGILAKKIRTSRVNYEYSGYTTPIVNPESELALTDLSGSEYIFKKSGNSLTISVDGGAEKSIPATNVNIDDLKFYINPTTDPTLLIEQYEEGQISQLPQPYVTIVMTVSSSKAGQSASLIVQQTVPQRSGGQ